MPESHIQSSEKDNHLETTAAMESAREYLQAGNRSARAGPRENPEGLGLHSGRESVTRQ
jgi:hypothetical protein